ncbi:unnamed protein product [Amaranthus hypochondriacus]
MARNWAFVSLLLVLILTSLLLENSISSSVVPEMKNGNDNENKRCLSLDPKWHCGEGSDCYALCFHYHPGFGAESGICIDGKCCCGY